MVRGDSTCGVLGRDGAASARGDGIVNVGAGRTVREGAGVGEEDRESWQQEIQRLELIQSFEVLQPIVVYSGSYELERLEMHKTPEMCESHMTQFLAIRQIQLLQLFQPFQMLQPLTRNSSVG
jgi:hypothetical protein